MNLILLFPSDTVSPGLVRLQGRRFRHVTDILKPAIGDQLAVGWAGGQIGTGRVCARDDQSMDLEVNVFDQPPAKLPLIVCAALMRPPVLRRVLQTAASLGAEQIVFFHSNRVEKSFWQSTALKDEDIREQLILGLEQSKDTVIPAVSLHKRFKPFVEHVLPGLLVGRNGVVADPAGDVLPGGSTCRGGVVIVIGPEGGFIPYEVELLKNAGCRLVALGPRILKVETALVSLISKFF